MIADFFLLIWVLAFSVPLYWALPPRWSGLRLGLLILVSWLLIWILSPVILLTVLFFGAILSGFTMAQRAGVDPGHLKTLSWGVFPCLLFFEFVPPDFLVRGLLGEAALNVQLIMGLAFLGVSYTAIRAFIMIRETLDGRGPTALEAATTFSFFGAFIAGPISGSAPYRNRAATLTLEDGAMALARIGWGGAMFLVAQPYVEGLDMPGLLGIAADGTLAAWAGVFQKFIALYLDFTGYTDVAIGCAMLYGIKLPENFNWPLRAKSIQEFWQRWHMSLGAFIGTYLFKPLVRQFGKPTTAIFLAFTAVGLWHQITWPYFLWGIGHGAALALNMMLRKAVPLAGWSRPALYALNLFGWAITMTYVALLSAFATSESLPAALSLLGRLFGVS
jgi:D-alanyl-lipoteichoic acid acyltransferase DltB (MBOAT superfamily)